MLIQSIYSVIFFKKRNEKIELVVNIVFVLGIILINCAIVYYGIKRY